MIFFRDSLNSGPRDQGPRTRGPEDQTLAMTVLSSYTQLTTPCLLQSDEVLYDRQELYDTSSDTCGRHR